MLRDLDVDRKIRVFEGGEYLEARPSIWEEEPPAALVSGTSVDLRVVVRPALFSPGAEIAAVTADLSALGGPVDVPLADEGNGTFSLETNLPLYRFFDAISKRRPT